MKRRGPYTGKNEVKENGDTKHKMKTLKNVFVSPQKMNKSLRAYMCLFNQA